MQVHGLGAVVYGCSWKCLNPASGATNMATNEIHFRLLSIIVFPLGLEPFVLTVYYLELVPSGNQDSAVSGPQTSDL